MGSEGGGKPDPPNCLTVDTYTYLPTYTRTVAHSRALTQPYLPTYLHTIEVRQYVQRGKVLWVAEVGESLGYQLLDWSVEIVRADIHTYIHIYTGTYIHTYHTIHTKIRTGYYPSTTPTHT